MTERPLEVTELRPLACLVLPTVRMLKDTELWRMGWQSCPGCGSYSISRALICSPCLCGLELKARAAFHISGDWSHRHLFDWVPGESDTLSKMISALKGRGEDQAWDYWAERFIHHHREQIFSLRNRVICAAPIKGDRKDHSAHFAMSLAKYLGLPYAGRPVLKTTMESSKRLSRKERLDRHDFVKNSEFSLRPECKVILVDDVLTTGATARAVRHFLRSSIGFEVWTLAARSRVSCGGSDPMIGI